MNGVILYVLKRKPVIGTFDVVADAGYEAEAKHLVEKFEEYLFRRDTSKPHLVVVLKGDGGICEVAKDQIRRENKDAIILGVKKPLKKGINYSRGTLAEVKDLNNIDRYLQKIKKVEYDVVRYSGVDLLIEDELTGTAFNEVLAIRDTGMGNQTIKFYALARKPNGKTKKLFAQYFTDGLITADGLVAGPPFGQGGYQKTACVPEYSKGIGVGMLSPCVEFKDEEMEEIERLYGREVPPRGLVLPEKSVIGFELRRGNGFIFSDHDLVAEISMDDLKTFEVKKSEERVNYIRFKRPLV